MDKRYFYEPISPPERGNNVTTFRFHSTGWTNGPWGRGLQHGGPVLALVGHCSQQVVPAPFRLGRVSGSFEAAVPVAPLTVTVTLTRKGKQSAQCEVHLFADFPSTPSSVGGVTDVQRRRVFAARVTLLRPPQVPPTPNDWFKSKKSSTANELESPDDKYEVVDGNLQVPKPTQVGESFPIEINGSLPGGVPPAEAAEGVGYVHAHETRLAAGTFMGPTAVWFRTHILLLPGVALTPTGRLLAAADSANGCSPLVPMHKFFYGAVDVDVTLVLAHQPQESAPSSTTERKDSSFEEDWICLACRTDLAPDGLGLSSARMFDSKGRFVATVTQTLIISKLPETKKKDGEKKRPPNAKL